MPYRKIVLMCMAALMGCALRSDVRSDEPGPGSAVESNSKDRTSGEGDAGRDSGSSPSDTSMQAASEPHLISLGAIRNISLPDAMSGQIVRSNLSAVLVQAADALDSFRQTVPRIVHRVLAPHEQADGWQGREAWQNYARHENFVLKTWHPTDFENRDLKATAAMQAAIAAATSCARGDVVSHLLGLAILNSQGGLWIGPEAMPPSVQGSALDFADAVDLEGLIVATNLRPRRVGGGSVYLTTALMLAPPGHPWVAMAAEDAARNTLQLLHAGFTDWPVRYYAGNAFLSKNLAGPFTVLPLTYLQDLHVFGPATVETAEDFLD